MFVTTLLAVSLAAPVPKAKAPELYYPTVEGTKYVMRRTVGKETVETTHTVTKAEEKDGTHTVTVSRDVGGQVVEFRCEVSAKGVFAVADPRGKFADPQPVLKLPAKEGDTWTSERPGPGKVAFTITHTVGKEEEVVVPAGKFKAIPVTTEDRLSGEARSVTTWYAAGVGVVKTVAVSNGAEQVQELKEFTPGKAK